MFAVERVLAKNEGTNLSTQFSSFLSLHSIRTEPPNTPCEKSINQSSHSTSCQGAAHTHILDVSWAPSSQPPPPPDSYLPPPDSYLPPPESDLSIFLTASSSNQKGNYAADHMQKNKHSDLKLS